jgi:hypothetical protein
MKRVLTGATYFAAFARRSLLAFATLSILSAALAAATSTPSLAEELTADGFSPVGGKDVFYTTSGAGTGMPNGAEIFAIGVSGNKITTRDVGPTYGGDCVTLALSLSGKLYGMCGSLFGAQHLATIDQETGRAKLFPLAVQGLAVMAMTFGPNGTLYAVGDCNPLPSFECSAGNDPNYNSVYSVNLNTGAFTRIGPTGAGQFFMDLAVDRNGTMFGVTTTVLPSSIPAILYRIDPATGTATKVVDLVGSNSVMGLAFGREGNLYGTDYGQNPKLYLIDKATGLETTIAALPFGFSSGLELMNPGDGEP